MANFSFNKRGDLVITLEDGDRGDIEYNRTRSGWTDNDVFLELIDYYLCNEWDVLPSGTLALVEDNRIILTEEMETDDDGNIVRIGAVYDFAQSLIRSEITELLDKGRVVMTKTL